MQKAGNNAEKQSKSTIVLWLPVLIFLVLAFATDSTATFVTAAISYTVGLMVLNLVLATRRKRASL